MELILFSSCWTFLDTAYKNAMADPTTGATAPGKIFIGMFRSHITFHSSLRLIFSDQNNFTPSHLMNYPLPCLDLNNCIKTAGLMAGATEAVLVVTPAEVIKIRLQAQMHSLADPMDIPKYR